MHTAVLAPNFAAVITGTSIAMCNGIINVAIPPVIVPAMAIPWLVVRLTNATIPNANPITPVASPKIGTSPMIPNTSAAIAKPLARFDWVAGELGGTGGVRGGGGATGRLTFTGGTAGTTIGAAQAGQLTAVPAAV